MSRRALAVWLWLCVVGMMGAVVAQALGQFAETEGRPAAWSLEGHEQRIAGLEERVTELEDWRASSGKGLRSKRAPVGKEARRNARDIQLLGVKVRRDYTGEARVKGEIRNNGRRAYQRVSIGLRLFNAEDRAVYEDELTQRTTPRGQQGLKPGFGWSFDNGVYGAPSDWVRAEVFVSWAE